MSRSNSKALKMSQVLDVERKADVLKISHWHDQFSSCELSKNVVLAIHNPIQYRFEKYCPLKLLLTLREDGWQIKKKFCDFLARLRELYIFKAFLRKRLPCAVGYWASPETPLRSVLPQATLGFEDSLTPCPFFYTILLIDETQLYHYLFGFNV